MKWCAWSARCSTPGKKLFTKVYRREGESRKTNDSISREGSSLGGKEKYMPKISVIVPIYNVEKYLNRCIDSITNQTYKNLEIILVDDGSPDNCGKICDEYAGNDSRIRVVHKANGGSSSARNAGLDIMTGEYVMFVDSDDYIAPDCVEYLFGLMDRFSAKICIGDYEATDSGRYEFGQNPERVEQISGKEAVERQFGKDTLQYVSPCAKLYARRLFAKLRFPEGRLIDDEGTMYRALYACDKVVVSKRVVYAYYYNSESITKRPKKKNYQDLCTDLNEQIEFYRERGEAVLEARVRNRWCIQAAAHYLPKGYYEEAKVLAQNAKRMYKGVWRVKQIPLTERVKGWMSAYLCGLTAYLMKHRRTKL